MISNQNRVLYACVAKKSTIVAEFSREPWLAEIAQKCIENTPPHHSMFSQTLDKRTYTFLIEGLFAYFAISDEDLDRSEKLWMLSRIKQAFLEKIRGGSIKDSINLSSRCFQTQMDPVFGETLVVDPAPKPSEGLKKKKASSEMGNAVDVIGCRDFPVEMNKNAPVMFPASERQRAKKVWKKHVWVVLMLDLCVCGILLGIWLWVCRGLECIVDG